MEKILKLNYKKILSFAILSVITMVLIFVGVKLAIFFLPFLIAFIIYKIIAKPVNFLTTKFKFPRQISAIICILLFIGIVGGLIYLFCAGVINELISLSDTSKDIIPSAYANITELLSRFTFFYNGLNLPEEVVIGIQSSVLGMVDTLLKSISAFLNSAVSIAVNSVIKIPNALIYVIITFLSTFFISSDAKFIKDSLEKHVPKKWIEKLQSIVNDLFSALGGYLKAQGILIVITFFELYIAFSIYGLEYALLLAMGIAIIDALPILGTGTIVIPWAIVKFATNDYRMGIYLIVLYFFVLIVRQLIEPKIVGSQIGIYPLLTLLAMYTGVQLIGVLGLIVGPIVLIIVKNILSEIYQKDMIRELFEYKEE